MTNSTKNNHNCLCDEQLELIVNGHLAGKSRSSIATELCDAWREGGTGMVSPPLEDAVRETANTIVAEVIGEHEAASVWEK